MKKGEIIEMVRQAQHLRMSIEADWVENVQFLMGRFGSRTEFEDMDRVDVNMCWSNMMAIIPTLYWANPSVLTKGKRPQDVLKAPGLAAGIQHWLGKIGTERVTQRMIIDAHCMSYGLGKLGYIVKDVAVAVKVDRATGGMQLVDESEDVDLSEFDVEQRTMSIGERPVFKRVSPLSHWIDPLCADFEESEWLCEEIVRDLKDLKKDPKYTNTSKLQASGNVNDVFASDSAPQRNTPRMTDQQSMSLTMGKVREGQTIVWEFWHKTERKLYTVIPDQGVVIRECDWPYPVFPYKAMQLGVPIPDCPYPTPPNSVWKAQQRELNKIRTYALDHIKRAIPKFLVDSAKLSREAQEAIKEGVMQVIMVDGDPSNVAKEMPGAPINPDVWRCEGVVKEDIQQVTGIADFQHATAATSGTTATEIRALSGAVAARVDYQRKQVASVIRWVAVGLHKLLRVFWDKAEWIKVTGRSDIEYVKMDAESLDGEFEIDIDVGSQLPPDKATNKKMAQDNFSILAPIAIQRPDLLKFDELVRYLMESLEIPDPDRFLTQDDANRPPSNPEDEELLLEQGGMPTFSPNDDQQLHIATHTQGLPNAKDDKDRWTRLMHLKKHLDYEQQRMLAAAMAQAQMLQQAQGGAGGPPGPGGPPPGGPQGGPPIQGGQGRAPAGNGRPMNAELYARDAPNPTTQSRVDSRRTN